MCSRQAQAPWGREMGLGVMCPMPWDTVPPCPDQSCTCSGSSLAGLSPPWAAWHRFAPGHVQFRPFSAVASNCYQTLSWPLGSNCCLGSNVPRRNSRNRRVLYVLPTDFSQNRIGCDKAGTGSAKCKKGLFILVPYRFIPRLC